MQKFIFIFILLIPLIGLAQQGPLLTGNNGLTTLTTITNNINPVPGCDAVITTDVIFTNSSTTNLPTRLDIKGSYSVMTLHDTGDFVQGPDEFISGELYWVIFKNVNGLTGQHTFTYKIKWDKQAGHIAAPRNYYPENYLFSGIQLILNGVQPGFNPLHTYYETITVDQFGGQFNPTVIGTEFIIDDDFEIYDGTFFIMASGSKITVESGNTLTIDGTLEEGCLSLSELWDGIHVEASGELKVVNGGGIKNVSTGIIAFPNSTIELDDCVLENFNMGLSVPEGDVDVTFNDCVMKSGIVGIYLKEQDLLSIHSSNGATLFEDMEAGVEAINSTVHSIGAVEFKNISGDGIRARSDNGTHFIAVKEGTFDVSGDAINADKMGIILHDLVVSSSKNGVVATRGFGKYYKIERCTLNSTHNAVYLNGAGNIGIVRNNVISTSGSIGQGISINSGGLGSLVSGNFFIEDNIINSSGGRNGINCQDILSSFIINNTLNGSSDDGILVQGSTGIDIIDNVINGSPIWGINILGSQACELRCNNVNGWTDGAVQILGVCSDTDIQTTNMPNQINGGISYSNYFTDLAITGPQIHNKNTWSHQDHTQGLTYFGNVVTATLSRFVADCSANGKYCPDFFPNNFFLEQIDPGPNTLNCTASIDNDGDGPGIGGFRSQNIDEDEFKLINGEFDLGFHNVGHLQYLIEQKYRDYKTESNLTVFNSALAVLDSIKTSPTGKLFEQDSILSQRLLDYSTFPNNDSIVILIDSIESNIESGISSNQHLEDAIALFTDSDVNFYNSLPSLSQRLDTSKQNYEAIETTNQVQKSQKELRIWIADNYLTYPDSLDFTVLDSVATKCPWIDGKSVWPARATLVGYDQSINFDDSVSCQIPESILVSTPFANRNEKRLTIYPNPAVDEFRVLYTGSERIKLHLSDITGKFIGMFDVKSGDLVNLSELSDGIYFLSTHLGDKYMSEKVIISRNE